MNVRLVALLLVALAAAGGAVFAASSWISAQRAELARSQQKPEIKQAAIEILVAHETLPTGTLLRKDHFRWQPWPSKTLSANYLRRPDVKIEDLVGAVVRNAVTLGEPITDAKIVHPGERGFLAAVLKPGNRAVTVGVNAVSGIAGFVFPGDRVDLLLTHEIKQDKKSRHATETVLADVRVLAIDQSTDDQAEKPKISKNVTLELTPKEAEKVTLMSALGRLSLSLRSLQREPAPELDPNLTPEALLASLNATSSTDGEEDRAIGHTWDSEVSPLLFAPPKKNQTVKVVRGGEAFVVQFAQGAGETESVVDVTPRGLGSGLVPNLALPSGTLPGIAADGPEGAN
jgi:pilus assembly protein CpaB